MVQAFIPFEASAVDTIYNETLKVIAETTADTDVSILTLISQSNLFVPAMHVQTIVMHQLLTVSTAKFHKCVC